MTKTASRSTKEQLVLAGKVEFVGMVSTVKIGPTFTRDKGSLLASWHGGDAYCSGSGSVVLHSKNKRYRECLGMPFGLSSRAEWKRMRRLGAQRRYCRMMGEVVDFVTGGRSSSPQNPTNEES